MFEEEEEEEKEERATEKNEIIKRRKMKEDRRPERQLAKERRRLSSHHRCSRSGCLSRCWTPESRGTSGATTYPGTSSHFLLLFLIHWNVLGDMGKPVCQEANCYTPNSH